MYQSRPWIDTSQEDILSWTFGNREIKDDQPIFVDAYDSTRSIAYSTAKKSVRQLIRGLKCHGLKKGDTVCVHSFNNVWYPIIYLAIIGAQGCFVGSNPAYKPPELRRLLQSSTAKFLILDSRQLDNVLPTATDVGINTKNIFILNEDTLLSSQVHLRSWKSLFSCGDEDWHVFHTSEEDKSTPAVKLSTSGTSGLPKLAIMSHRGILAQAKSAAYTVEEYPEKIRRLISLPFFHSFVLPFHLLALRRGQTTFVMQKFDTNDYASFIDKYDITMVPIVPPIALKVFALSILNCHDLSSLRQIVCAGARLDIETQAMIARRLHPEVNFSQLWGLSELGWVTAFKCDETDWSGSVGRLLPNVEAKIVSSNGGEMQNHTQEGEIHVKSPGMMLGYAGDPAETAAAETGDWFRTGDIGYCKDGKWYIIDRAKDMIKVRAWQVSPAEVEVCILVHPGVGDVAVAGIQAGIGTGEIPVAFIVPQDSQTDLVALERDTRATVKQKLTSYKSVGQIVFVDHIPRTASGKTLRRILRRDLLNQQDRKANEST